MESGFYSHGHMILFGRHRNESIHRVEEHKDKWNIPEKMIRAECTMEQINKINMEPTYKRLKRQSP